MWKSSLLSLVALALLLSASPSAKANVGYASNGKAAAVAAGLAGAGAGIAFLIYYSTHRGHSLRGCAASSPDGLQLMSEGDQRSYSLSGDIAGIKSGDRVRVSGSKVKGDSKHRKFVVTKLSKDYGACKVMAAVP